MRQQRRVKKVFYNTDAAVSPGKSLHERGKALGVVREADQLLRRRRHVDHNEVPTF